MNTLDSNFNGIKEYLQRRIGIPDTFPDSGALLVCETDMQQGNKIESRFVLWWMHISNGPDLVRVPKGFRSILLAFLEENSIQGRLPSRKELATLRGTLDEFQSYRHGRRVVDIFHDYNLGCSRNTLAERVDLKGPAQVLAANEIGQYDMLVTARQVGSKGCILRGVELGGKIVSIAFTHGLGVMADSITHVGVKTAIGYRKKGLAKAALHSVASEFFRTTSGVGEMWYGCDCANEASLNTALSAGFKPFGESIIFLGEAESLSDAEPYTTGI